MDRARWLAEKRAEVTQLGEVRISEITPSRRDFRLYVATQRQELAVIARLQRRDAQAAHEEWLDADLLAHARACDDAEVAALAVATDRQRGGSLDLLNAVAATTSAPILRDDLVLSASQLYDARLHGADAVVFPAAELADPAVAELIRVASSLHMASIVEVQSPTDVAKVLTAHQAVIGLNADLQTMLDVAPRIPTNRMILALREPEAIADIRRLRGVVDAVVLGPRHLLGADIAAVLARLNAG